MQKQRSFLMTLVVISTFVMLPLVVNCGGVGSKASDSKSNSTIPKYAISGKAADPAGVGVAGAYVFLWGSAASTTTGADGTYVLPKVANGTYELIINKTGCSFSPSSKTVTVSNADISQNFTWIAATGPVNNSNLGGGLFAYFPEMVADSSDTLHAIYFDNSQPPARVMYASRSIGSWATRTIDTANAASIAADTKNKVHIIHDLAGLYYTTNTTGTWSTSFIGSFSSPFVKVAADSNDNLHVFNGSLYISNSTGTWSSETFDSSVKATIKGSIKVDSNNAVHICYGDQGNAIKYATNATGSWDLVTIQSPVGGEVFNCSLAVDGNEKIHIATIDSKSGMHYSTNAAGSWATVTLISGNTNILVFPPSIAVDTNNKVHIMTASPLTGTQNNYFTDVSGTLAASAEFPWPSPTLAIDSNNRRYSCYYQNGVMVQLYYANSFF